MALQTEASGGALLSHGSVGLMNRRRRPATEVTRHAGTEA
jgi:hypothetical protein